MIRLLPLTLFGRLVLILLGGLLVAQLVGAAILLRDRATALYETSGRYAVQRIVGIVNVLDELSADQRRLILPAINGSGGPIRVVQRAIRRLENFTDPADYLLSAAAASTLRPGGRVAALPLDMRLAIEMAVNEEAERFALEGEMWLLEWAWQEAEEIAAIADDLTVPEEVEEKLQQLRERAGGIHD